MPIFCKDHETCQEFCKSCHDGINEVFSCFTKPAEATKGRAPSGLAGFELLSARKLKAFDWLDANADELSMEWTGTHNHIYSGNEENLERLGCGRSLLEAIENCMGI